MNIFAIIILSTILIEFVLSLISNQLNLKSLKSSVPDEFEGVYDEDTYARSQEYTKVNTRFGYLTGSFDLLLVLAFWFLGGFNWLDIVVRDFGFNELITGLFYVGIPLIAKTIISLPFSIYSTFVIEERFGFNKTTPRTFVMDMVKGFVLFLILFAPLVVAIQAFFIYAGEWGWLYAWMGGTAFLLGVQYIAPNWIMPLFNKFTPLEDGELKTEIQEYTQKVKFSLTGLFVIDGSTRSTKSNAFFTGFGKNKRVALYDTLIENHTVPELVAVLAHEIGHYKKKHIIKGNIVNTLQNGVLFFLISIFLNNTLLFEAFYMENVSVYASLVFISMMFSPVYMLLSIFMNLTSRKHEYEADAYAVETTGNPNDMVSTLKKLSKDNLSNLTPHPFYVFLNYSHPPVLQRIEAIRKLGHD